MKKAPLTKKTRQRNRAPSNGTDFDTSQLLSALMSFKRGDFSARLPVDLRQPLVESLEGGATGASNLNRSTTRVGLTKCERLVTPAPSRAAR